MFLAVPQNCMTPSTNGLNAVQGVVPNSIPDSILEEYSVKITRRIICEIVP